MKRINSCLCLVLANILIGCSGKVNDKDSAHIVVVGTAINMKGGAAVASNEDIYYLEGKYSWEDHTLEKRVRVEGDLFVKIYPAPPCPELPLDGSPPPPPPQNISLGFKQIIKNPKW